MPHWRGVNHLALITHDMDATVRFYHGVLGARLVAHLGNESFRHYFFELGAGNTVAFFEYRTLDITPFAKPAGMPDPRAVQFDHVSFNLPDEQALLNLRARLKAAGSEVTDVVDHGFIRSIYFTDPSGIALEASWWVTDVVDHGFIHSIYFTDPSGIALEASWWVTDATGRDADYRDPGLFADPDPVPAVLELQATGRLASVPATKLS